MNFTEISIKLMLLNAIVLSVGVMQKVLDLNIFPENLEAFAYGIVICFEIFVTLLYFIALLSEIKEIKNALIFISRNPKDQVK